MVECEHCSADLVPIACSENNMSTLVFEDADDEFTALLGSLATDDECAAHADVRVSFSVSTQSTVDLRREQERAKNRRNAAAYRARCKVQRKELEGRLESAKTQLSDAKERWRVSRQRHQTLLEMLPTQPQPADAAGQESPPSRARQHTTFHMSAEHDRLSTRQSVDEFQLQTQQPEQAQLVLKLGTEGIWGSLEHPSRAHKWDTPPSINSAKHCAPVSYALVQKYLLPRELWTACHSNGVVQAVSDYQHSVCAALCLQPRDICWFCQYPCHTFSLSYSVGVRSPECSLSTSLYMVATRVESLCLAVEHELVSAALDPTYVAPNHPTLDLPDDSIKSHTAALHAPSPPDAGLLKAFHVRCGVNEVAPLAEGVARVLQPLLRAYRARLPQAAWRAICIQLMHVLKTSLDPLQKKLPKHSASESQFQTHASHRSGNEDCGNEHRAPSNGESAASAELTAHYFASGGMQWGDLDMALCALQQQALCTIHSVLTEADEMEGVPTEVRSLQAVQDRMHEVITTVGIFQNLFMSHVPVIARRFFVRSFLTELIGHDQCTAQVTQQHAKLYKQLQLLPTQRSALADRWHAWCMRCKALDAKQHDALRRLNGLFSLLAQSSQIQWLIALANGVEQGRLGADTTARGSPLNSGTKCCATCNATSNGFGPEFHDVRFSENVNSCQKPQNTTGGLCSTPNCNTQAEHGPAGCVQALQGAHTSHQHGCRLPCADSEAPLPTGRTVFQLPGCTGSMVIDPRWPHASEIWGAATTAASSGTDEFHSCRDPQQNGAQSGHSASVLCHDSHHRLAEVCVIRAVTEANTNAAEARSYQTEDPGCHNAYKDNCTHTKRNVPTQLIDSLAAACNCRSPTCCFRRMQAKRKQAKQNASLCSNQSIRSGLSYDSSKCTSCAHGHKGLECDESGQPFLFLGMGGGLEEVVSEAFRDLKEVHMSDGFMHREFLVPYIELNEAQNCLLLSAKIDLELPPPDIMRLFCTAAEEQRRDKLFGCFRSL